MHHDGQHLPMFLHPAPEESAAIHNENISGTHDFHSFSLSTLTCRLNPLWLRRRILGGPNEGRGETICHCNRKSKKLST